MPTDGIDTPRPPAWKLLAAFGIVCLGWGSSWALVRMGLQTMPVLLSAGLRLLIASVFLLLYVRVRGIAFPADREFWILNTLLTLSAVVLPMALIYWAQQRIDSGLAAVLFSTLPFSVVAFGRLFLPDERVPGIAVGGLVAGFLGIVVIMQMRVSDGASSILPMAAVVAAGALEGLTLVLVRQRGSRFSPEMLNIVPMAIGAVVFLVLAGLTEPFSPATVSPAGVVALLILGIFSTALASVLYFWLARYVPVVSLSLSAFVTPVIAVLIGVLALAEPLSVHFLAGVALVLGGILLVVRPVRHG